MTGNTLCFSKTSALIAARIIRHEFANCPHGVVVAARLKRMIDEGYFREDPPPPVVTGKTKAVDPKMPPRNGNGASDKTRSRKVRTNAARPLFNPVEGGAVPDPAPEAP